MACRRVCGRLIPPAGLKDDNVLEKRAPAVTLETTWCSMQLIKPLTTHNDYVDACSMHAIMHLYISAVDCASTDRCDKPIPPPPRTIAQALLHS